MALVAGEGWRWWVVVAAVVVVVDLWTTPGRGAARGGVLASMCVAAIAVNDVNGVGERGGVPSTGGSIRVIIGEARGEARGEAARGEACGAVAPFL